MAIKFFLITITYLGISWWDLTGILQRLLIQTVKTGQLEGMLLEVEENDATVTMLIDLIDFWMAKAAWSNLSIL